MVDNQDWAAICDSEVFRNYVAQELHREQKEAELVPVLKSESEEKQLNEMETALDGLDNLEAKIKENHDLLKKFQQVREALTSNPELIEKTDPNFVRGIMMLDLPDIIVEDE